jgi:hypothetical protein
LVRVWEYDALDAACEPLTSAERELAGGEL